MRTYMYSIFNERYVKYKIYIFVLFAKYNK